MKSTTLKTLFFGLFLIATFAVKAQENTAKSYEYAIVASSMQSMIVAKTVEGQPTEKIKMPKEEQYPLDYSTVLRVIAEMREQGWSVFSSNVDNLNAYFVLRRLKK